MTHKKLEELRQEIDRIDYQLVSLLSQRLNLAKDIAAIKKKSGLGIRDEIRERRLIERARKQARELKMDPDFLESLVRLVVTQTAVEERETLGMPYNSLWSHVQKVFKDYPAQISVAKVLFKHGMRVGEDGAVLCGNIRVPAVQIAKEAGVDRRVVDATTKRILEDKELSKIFQNLESFAYFKNLAQTLGLGVIEVLPEDATKPGILRDVAKIIADAGITIRQTVADDPFFAAQPKLTVVTDKPLPGAVIEALRKAPGVQSIIIY